MLDERHLTCQLHDLTLLDQQMLCNNVRTCSRGLRLYSDFLVAFLFYRPSFKKKLKETGRFSNSVTRIVIQFSEKGSQVGKEYKWQKKNSVEILLIHCSLEIRPQLY